MKAILCIPASPNCDLMGIYTSDNCLADATNVTDESVAAATTEEQLPLLR